MCICSDEEYFWEGYNCDDDEDEDGENWCNNLYDVVEAGGVSKVRHLCGRTFLLFSYCVRLSLRGKPILYYL